MSNIPKWKPGPMKNTVIGELREFVNDLGTLLHLNKEREVPRDEIVAAIEEVMGDRGLKPKE